MARIKGVKTSIITKLQEVTELALVTGSIAATFDVMPIAAVIFRGAENEFEDTRRNKETLKFTIHLLYEANNLDTSEDALMELVEKVSDKLDSDRTLGNTDVIYCNIDSIDEVELEEGIPYRQFVFNLSVVNLKTR